MNYERQTKAQLIERIKVLENRISHASCMGQEFILHLHDDTLWPAKYYKDVLYYLLDGGDIPVSIHYTRCCREWSKYQHFASINQLPDIWEKQADLYPRPDATGVMVASAVRLCANELREAISTGKVPDV